MEEAHLNVYHLSKRWGLSTGTLDHWRRYGKGPRFLKIGGHVLYRLCDIRAYEEQQVRQTTVKDRGVLLAPSNVEAA